MPLIKSDREQIKSALMLELNSAFTRVWKKYMAEGTEDHQAFLKHLIDEVKECIAKTEQKN